MRRRPKPWGDRLWDRVSRFLEDLTSPGTGVDFDDANRPELGEEAMAIRREMLEEETRWASGEGPTP
jgi:hypothetical protein